MVNSVQFGVNAYLIGWALAATLLVGCDGWGDKLAPREPTTGAKELDVDKQETYPPARRWTVNELQPTVVGYPSRGVVLGQAFDFVEQRWLSTVCVNGKPADLGAGEMTVKFSDLFDRKQIFDALKLSVSAESSFGGGNASASVEHSKSVTVKAERRNVMVTIDSMRGGFQLAPADGALGVTLTTEATKHAKNKPIVGKPDAFRARCGDGFAVAIRHGARLNGVMSYAMDATEVEEILKLGASGGYGPVKAKASMERISKKEGATKHSDLTMLQVGGNREKTPTTVDGMIEAIESFGKYSAAEAVPVEVVIIPYRALSDVPDDFRGRQLPDPGVRGLASHYWRLVDLSGLYARAAVRPADYYHPFLPPGDALNRRARVLQEAARCVNLILEQCSAFGTSDYCTMEGLAKESAKNKVCIRGRSDLPDEEIIDTMEVAVGRVSAERILDASARFQEGDAKKTLESWKKLKPAKDVAFRTLSQSASPKASPREPLWKANVYDGWFMSYAQAPWPRIVGATNGKVTPEAVTDLHSMLAMFCKTASVDCQNLAGNTGPTVKAEDVNAVLQKDVNAEDASKAHKDVENKLSRAEVFKEFVVAVRLFPVAAVVCESEIDHPMCQLPDVLRFYVSTAAELTPITFGEARYFTKPTPPPTATSRHEAQPREIRCPFPKAGRGCHGEHL